MRAFLFIFILCEGALTGFFFFFRTLMLLYNIENVESFSFFKGRYEGRKRGVFLDLALLS